MATIQFTNQTASQALKGQSVEVTVASDEIEDMQDISKGMLATIDSNGITGLVHRVDYFGNSFLVNPIQPDRSFGIYGYLAASETVTITT